MRTRSRALAGHREFERYRVTDRFRPGLSGQQTFAYAYHLARARDQTEPEAARVTHRDKYFKFKFPPPPRGPARQRQLHVDIRPP